MRILFVMSSVPYPPRQGGQLRAFSVLQAMASGHDVSLVTFVDAPSEECPGLFAIPQVLPGVRVLPIVRGVAATRTHDLMDDVLYHEAPDLVHFDDIYATSLFRGLPEQRLSLNVHNIEFMLHKRMEAAGDVRRYTGFWRAMLPYELAVMKCQRSRN